MKNNSEKTPGLLHSVLSNHCPHCREGYLFTERNPYNLKHTMKMPETCPVCGQKFELEPGFYFGTGYVSYAMSVLFTGLCFIAYYFLVGISIYDNSIYKWLVVNGVLLIAFQPALQRLARSVWIAFFVKYDPNYKVMGV